MVKKTSHFLSLLFLTTVHRKCRKYVVDKLCFLLLTFEIDATYRFEIVAKFLEIGCNVFIFDYRGYGKSEGRPTEKGLQLDSIAAWRFLYGRHEIDHNNVFIYGKSLGGAVAIYLTKTVGYLVKGLIIENTFLSVPHMIDVVYPLLSPFKFLCRNKWESFRNIQQIMCPILFLSGKSDQLIPPKHVETLYGIALASSRTLVTFPNGGHETTWMQPRYFEEIESWIQEGHTKRE